MPFLTQLYFRVIKWLNEEEFQYGITIANKYRRNDAVRKTNVL